MNLETTHTYWSELQNLKLKYLRDWEPEKDSLQLSDLSSIPDMAAKLNRQMAQAMDHQEVHDCAYALAQQVAALSPEDFRTWNQGEIERAQVTGQLMSEISSAKLVSLLGF